MGYIYRNWGEKYKHLSPDALQVEMATMIHLRAVCAQTATDDLKHYTKMMAHILEVKTSVVGCESTVHDRNDWTWSIIANPSNLQIQKWIFAWLYARSNYKKFVTNFKN